MNHKLLLASMSIIAICVGCGRSPADVSTAPATNARDQSLVGTSNVPLSVADASQPAEVVAAFLDALRDGDNEVAESLLTTVARRETHEHDLPVQAPGSPTARYEIGEVTFVQGGVHVNSIWSEVDSSGEQSIFEIVWVLRQEPMGWRVAGMATAVNPAKPPIYLNFEDISDLLEKWRQADEELASQTGEAGTFQDQSLQATQPGTTLQR